MDGSRRMQAIKSKRKGEVAFIDTEVREQSETPRERPAYASNSMISAQ